MYSELTQWLSYIESIHPKKMDLGLHRIQALVHHFGVKKFDVPIVSVAGTNGKGSTLYLLQNLLKVHGHRAGGFISPHLIKMNERIHINGVPIQDEALIAIFQFIEDNRKQQTLTFFEYLFLSALIYFKQENVDYILLEVGLGGRLDAVNAIDANLAVITQIDLDHCHILGQTRAEIALEKAGIFRPRQRVIWGDRVLYPGIRTRVRELQIELIRFQHDYQLKQNVNSWDLYLSQVTLKALPIPKIPIENAAIAIQALVCLKPRFNPLLVSTVLKQFFAQGRFQTLNQNFLVCPITVDVGHNPRAAIWFAEQVKKQKILGRKWLLFGVMADKDWHVMLSSLLPVVHTLIPMHLPVTRALNPQEIIKFLPAEARHSELAQGIQVDLALQKLKKLVKPIDHVFIFGSFVTVGEALKLIK